MKKRELKKWCPEAVNTLNGGAAQNTGHEVSDKQKARMTANLTKSFALLETVLELRLAYLKKMNPNKTEQELKREINRAIIATKERQWTLQQNLRKH